MPRTPTFNKYGHEDLVAVEPRDEKLIFYFKV